MDDADSPRPRMPRQRGCPVSRVVVSPRRGAASRTGREPFDNRSTTRWPAAGCILWIGSVPMNGLRLAALGLALGGTGAAPGAACRRFLAASSAAGDSVGGGGVASRTETATDVLLRQVYERTRRLAKHGDHP